MNAEIDQHNLRETKALIAALSEDWPEVDAQLDCLDNDGLVALSDAAGELADRAWTRLRVTGGAPPRG